MTSPIEYVEALIDWEEGTLDEAREAEVFQFLIDSGLTYTLPGRYGRHAQGLLDAGVCTPPGAR